MSEDIQNNELQEETKLQEEIKETITQDPKTEVVEESSQPEEFDWESYEEQDRSDYDKTQRNEMEEMYKSTLTEIVENVVTTATIIEINEKDAVVNLGFKSDGLIPLSEFKYREEINVGDEIEVIVETTEDKDGCIVLSHKKALAETAWQKIQDAHEKGTIMKGYIKDRTKGGMVVDLLTLDAFLPGSQIDIKPIQDYDSYIGKYMDLKVVKLNPMYRNVVVSHKAIIEQDLAKQRDEILAQLDKGQILEGIVKNLTSFGVFVDLGGVDGLVHITDVSWGRISHPDELLEIGQQIKVVIIDYDKEKKRISLGIKQLTPHPWETLPEDIVEGSVLKGKIVNLEDYGAFVEIHKGVEGLVHVSEMSWTQHLKSPSDYVHIGQEVEVKVLNINREERKLSLGMKQLTEDPWEGIEERYPKGSKQTAVVRSVTNFGMFMELEEGIDGLMHVSDLSWTKKYNHPNEFIKTGENLEVVILDIDKENRRLSLGHKQIEDNPWDSFEEVFAEGTIHDGVVSKIDDNGAIILLAYGVEAYCSARNLIKKDKSPLNEDETLPFKVTEFDKNGQKIYLSHVGAWKVLEKRERKKQDKLKEEEDKETQEDIKKVSDKVEKSTFADEHEILNKLKEEMSADTDDNQEKEPNDENEEK